MVSCNPFSLDYRVTRVLPTQLSLLGIERAQRQWQTGPSTLCALAAIVSLSSYHNLIPSHPLHPTPFSEHCSVVLKDVSISTDRLFVAFRRMCKRSTFSLELFSLVFLFFCLQNNTIRECSITPRSLTAAYQRRFALSLFHPYFPLPEWPTR